VIAFAESILSNAVLHLSGGWRYVLRTDDGVKVSSFSHCFTCLKSVLYVGMCCNFFNGIK